MRRALHFIVVGGGPTGARATCLHCLTKWTWLFSHSATECSVHHLTRHLDLQGGLAPQQAFRVASYVLGCERMSRGAGMPANIMFY